MTPEDIIEQDARKLGANPETVLEGVHHAISKGGRLLREGDSLLLITPLRGDKSRMFMHFFSVASPASAMSNVKKFVQRVRAIPNLKLVYGDTKDQQIIRLLQMAGVKVLASDIPHFTWMAEV